MKHVPFRYRVTLNCLIKVEVYLSFLLDVYKATANSLTMNSLRSPKNYVNILRPHEGSVLILNYISPHILLLGK